METSGTVFLIRRVNYTVLAFYEKINPMPTVPVVSVIIVSWNVADLLDGCLKSIRLTKYPALEVIVVDNASSDRSLKILSQKSFRNLNIKIIKNSINLGFPKAVNQGLDIAGGEYILLLNPDCLLSSDFFNSGIRFFNEYPDAALLGPEFLNPDGTAQGSVFPEPSVINTLREFWFGNKNLTAKYIPYGDQPVKVNAVSGACMLFPRTTLALVGRLTEKIFMYYEDLDFCRRIRRAGWFIYFHPGIQITHEHGASSRQSPLALKYLWQSSLWYNGLVKHYLIFLISYSGQKFRKLHNIM